MKEENLDIRYRNIDEDHFKLGRRKYRRVGPWGMLIGGLAVIVIIFLASKYIPRYLKEEAMLHDFPKKISLYLVEAKYKEADKIVAKAESELGGKPNILTPLRSVTQLHILAMNINKTNIEANKLAKMKEDLLKIRTTLNGYPAYRKLVESGDDLLSILEDSMEVLKLIEKKALKYAWSRSDRIVSESTNNRARDICLFVAFYVKCKIALATNSNEDNQAVKKLGRKIAKNYNSPIIKRLELLKVRWEL